jgi:outer membrane protein OmpA-like peptidoglycan-associated protein
MDFVNDIKNSVSSATIENFSQFFGEKPSDVNSGLQLSLKAFMAGLLKFSATDQDVKGILGILNDGGHTGEIFKNLENFSTNNEKTQLLIKIGNNIVNHFLKNSSNDVVEKISKIAEVRKTSASSLLSLAAPLVLGYIGKRVKENNLDVSGLKNWFSDISDSVFQSLPPAISNIFPVKKEVKKSNYTAPVVPEKITPVKEKIKVEKPKSQKSSVNWGIIIPWLILGVVGIFALGYWFKNKIKEKENIGLTPVFKEKEVELRPEDFLPDSTVANLPPEVNKVDPVEKTASMPASENQTEVAKSEYPVVAQPKPQSTKADATPKSESKTSGSNLNQSTKKTELKSTETMKSESETAKPQAFSVPSGFNSPVASTFKSGSAEVSDFSDVKKIASQLANSEKTVQITMLSGTNATLSEDRAYAFREALIERGVDESQIIMKGKNKGFNATGIAFKIVN